MGGSKVFVWLSLVLVLATGCPLEDDPVEDGRANASPADGGGTGNQNNGGDEPANTGDTGDDNSSDNGDDNGSNGTDNNGGSEVDAGSNGELDAGSTGELDAGGGLDASASNGSDASVSTGADASTSTGSDAAVTADAGPEDSGMSEPDSHVEEDAGPPIVVPDLGAADMSDADRAALIVNYLTSEGYESSWYPVLQSEAVQRPLIVTPSHGTSVRAFQNAVSKQALDAWVDGSLPLPLDMPNGSVIVKESYKVDAMTQQVVPNGKLIMAKIDALDPVAYEGNWFFMRITTANVAARATTCVDCHNGRKATGAWPVDPANNPMGGRTNALVPYDYMFIPYCYDERTPECSGPN